jgi:Bacterial nucleoid DNA-binding protein
MVKSELIKKLCDSYPNILRKDIEKILDVIFHEITAALKRGENVEIRERELIK